jgi:hypothetical protein
VTVRVNFLTTDFVKLIDRLKEKATRVNPAIAKTMNQVGNHLLEQVVETIAAQTDMEPEVIRQRVRVKRASAGDLTFRINAEDALVEAQTSRPMRKRGFVRKPEEFFNKDELVNIVTMDDEDVCPICQELAADGPYPIEEARMKIPAHPNCRCLVQTFRKRRTLPVEFRRGQDVEVSRVTMTELVASLKNDLKIIIKAK